MAESIQTILLVDDDEELRTMLRVFVEQAGYCVLVAANGAEGVNVAQAHTHKLDLILMDLEMPVLDGFGAVARIREKVSDVIPIIAMSAHCWNYDWKTKAKSIGCIDCVDKNRLLDFIIRDLRGYLS